jgi:RNA polymerase sigma factor (sigma-70 family)
MNPLSQESAARDAELVQACLAGDPAAWESLIDKYKRLIYSVPLRYRLSPDDAADVFQLVCIDLYRDLSKLREVGALRGWLARVAAHHSLRIRKKQSRDEDDESSLERLAANEETDREVHEAEQRQLVRESIESLPDRCRELVKMLFYSDPPPSYDEVAARFGVAKGSIGFIRGRCLQKLEKALKESGL